MPRWSILTASEKESLIAIPESEEELIRYYTLSETDFSIIRQHRGAQALQRVAYDFYPDVSLLYYCICP